MLMKIRINFTVRPTTMYNRYDSQTRWMRATRMDIDKECLLQDSSPVILFIY
jgi:hypothetical protein